MTSVGLVLGAGGITGAAYHAGVLTALAEAGFDARSAEIVVGTSAGSGVGATLRAGFPPADLAPRTLGEPVSAAAQAIIDRTGGPPELDLRPRPFRRVPVPSSPTLLWRRRRPTVAMTGLLPEGTIPTGAIGERIQLLYGAGPDGAVWPELPLWICAVRLETGALTVFGRDDIDVPIWTAVEASSAIPGFFAPVRHGGSRYVDGGVHSPTNADLLAGLGLDVVVVSSPMSATSDGLRTGLPHARAMHARRLGREVAAIRAAGTTVLTFQPTASAVAVMGRNAMDASRRESTVRSVLDSSRQRLADPAVADRLALLA